MKPSAPPAPPRRHSSGIRNPDPIEQQPATQNYGEPPTMAAARARIHEIARELPAENRFDRHHDRHNFNDETQGRIEGADLAAAHAAYDRRFPEPAHHGHHGGADPLDQLPALGHHEHFDAEYQQHDPMTALRPAYDEVLQRHEDKYRGDEPYRDDAFPDRPLPEDDSSGEYARRQRHSPPPPATYSAASNSYDPAAYEANYPKGGRREEPSYADRRPSYRGEDNKSQAPKSDRRNRSERDDARDDGRSFRRDELPREGSYRDEPRRDERREDNRSFRRDERASSYQPPRPEQRDETRAEGSSAKHERKGDSYGGNEPSIPGPARVPAELRVPDNFVVGVQPIRTPSMGASAAFPQPQAVITPAYGPAMTAAASPGAMGGQMQMGMPLMPQISMPPMMAPMTPMMGPSSVVNQMHVRAHTSARPPGHVPQMTEVEEAQQSSKVGRFAWFVFGAAFGIFFAFAATGFGFGKKEEPPPAFPPAPAQLPVQTQQPVAPPPPPVVQQPMQPMAPQQPMQPMAPQQPMQPQMMQPQMNGVAPPVAPPPPLGVMVAPNQNVGPIVPAAQPAPQPGGRAQQQAQPQQQGAVVRGGGRPAGGGGGARRGGGARPAQPQNDGDDAPAPKKSGGGEPNVADLLGQGLGN
ncbi:MAG: hypothetical protein U0270_22780 [Labilithrix sp.]